MTCELCKSNNSASWVTLDGWVFCEKCFNRLKGQIIHFYGERDAQLVEKILELDSINRILTWVIAIIIFSQIIFIASLLTEIFTCGYI